MLTETQGGVLVVSVDMDFGIDQRSGQRVRGMAQTCADLVGLFARYRLSATWGVADPVHSAVTRTIVSGPVKQEIAILGDGSWVGRDAGRTRFARELARRADTARAAGLLASTLVLRGAKLSENLDLLAKHRISMVRPCLTMTDACARRCAVRSLRYGVWQLPVDVGFPQAHGWLSGGSRAALRRAIQRATKPSQIVHVTIDGVRLSQSRTGEFRLLELFLHDTVGPRQKGQIRVRTLRGVAADLAAPAKRGAAQSILRKAA